jgi:hypothetical protein
MGSKGFLKVREETMPVEQVRNVFRPIVPAVFYGLTGCILFGVEDGLVSGGLGGNRFLLIGSAGSIFLALVLLTQTLRVFLPILSAAALVGFVLIFVDIAAAVINPQQQMDQALRQGFIAAVVLHVLMEGLLCAHLAALYSGGSGTSASA